MAGFFFPTRSNFIELLNVLQEAQTQQHDEHLSPLTGGDQAANQLSLSYL